MEQSKISAPQVGQGERYSVFYSVYLHCISWILRKTVAYLSAGDEKLFDQQIVVQTPDLGEGFVKCAACIPPKSGPADKLPLILVIEGGGFVLGQPSDGAHIDRPLSDRLNAIVISVEYAKSPRYPFPHALLQLHQVLKWSLSPAATEKLGVQIDASRVAIMGNSAGGNLTASLSLLHAFTSGPCAKFRNDLPKEFLQVAQVLIYPSVACHKPYRERFAAAANEPAVQKASLPIWMAESMEASYLPPHIDKQQIFIAPVLAASSLLQELAPRLPSVACYVAGLDCLKYEAVEYCTKLQDVGVDVQMREFREAAHGFSHYKEGNEGYREEDVKGCWDDVCRVLGEAFERQ